MLVVFRLKLNFHHKNVCTLYVVHWQKKWLKERGIILMSCKAENLLDNKKAMLSCMESKVGVGISYLLEKNGNVDFFRIYVSNITTLWVPSGIINHKFLIFIRDKNTFFSKCWWFLLKKNRIQNFIQQLLQKWLYIVGAINTPEGGFLSDLEYRHF